MNEFVMDSIGMFNKLYQFYGSFINFYEYNHKRLIKIYDYIVRQKIIL